MELNSGIISLNERFHIQLLGTLKNKHPLAPEVNEAHLFVTSSIQYFVASEEQVKQMLEAKMLPENKHGQLPGSPPIYKHGIYLHPNGHPYRFEAVAWDFIYGCWDAVYSSQYETPGVSGRFARLCDQFDQKFTYHGLNCP